MMLKKTQMLTAFVTLLAAVFTQSYQISENDALRFRERVHKIFKHAYTGYMKYAYPKDELCPLTCTGFDTLGGYSLTLIDSLDSLFVLNMCDEFRDAYSRILKIDFRKDVNVSVFETNIRVVGGLLAGHMVAPYCGVRVPDGWPCAGPMLKKAASMADKLLEAFETETEMPVGTVNLLHGIPEGETRETCTAGVGTFIMEFGGLSALTGDEKYIRKARKAMDGLWKYRSSIDLVGCHLNVSTGEWTDSLFTIGSSVDSYLEYLLKGGILFNDKELLRRFDVHMDAIKKHARVDDFHIYVSSKTGTPSHGLFQSLDAFFPGMLALSEKDIESAISILFANHGLWTAFGCLPEHFDLITKRVLNTGPGYPLRPEHIESVMYLYRVLLNIGPGNDPESLNHSRVLTNKVLRMAVDVLTSLESQFQTECGFAGSKDVRTSMLVNRMESFFLSETLKYLYLIFDRDNIVFKGATNVLNTSSCPGYNLTTGGAYLFTTEGHLVDRTLTDCCDRFHKL